MPAMKPPPQFYPLILLVLNLLLVSAVCAAPKRVSFADPTSGVPAYEFAEVRINVDSPDAGNPFTDVTVEGSFAKQGGQAIQVVGFCDAADGSVYHIRFMPAAAGDYPFSVTFRQGELVRRHSGTFHATESHHRGILRVDKEHPFHFVWEGTGEHYFFNGTTAFLLMGWRDERVIRDSIDRIAAMKANRIRVLLNGRVTHSFWGEPIVPSPQFKPAVDPWPAAHPDDAARPQFDFTRFNLSHWQRFERMLAHARSKDVIISVILDWNDSKEHAAAAGEDERRYYRHAAARLGAFSNITWDLGDDISSFRPLAWSHEMGTFLQNCDPYHHLATDHPVDNAQQDRASDWFGFTSFQEWSRPQHGWMLMQREAQKKTGRLIPQTNEEYGYEDHYPNWAKYGPPIASADNMRRIGWEIAMAGCYQTTGETARRGAGYWPDTGGGWVNGRGDKTMTMLEGYAHVLEFITRFEWWKAEPHDELVDNGNYCLAEPGAAYAVYLPKGGQTQIRLQRGPYDCSLFDPRTGKSRDLPRVEVLKWTTPPTPDQQDWAILLRRGK
jgi:hypothetical protein